MDSETPIPPAHIEATVRSIAELHAKHDRRASLYQRSIERLIEQSGRPASAGVIVDPSRIGARYKCASEVGCGSVTEAPTKGQRQLAADQFKACQRSERSMQSFQEELPSLPPVALIEYAPLCLEKAIMRLYSKRVVALGGTSGIGLEVTRTALDEGASVVVSSSSKESVERAYAELRLQASSESVWILIGTTETSGARVVTGTATGIAGKYLIACL